jgi:uncharacterized protein YjgD (DUF1641 family)
MDEILNLLYQPDPEMLAKLISAMFFAAESAETADELASSIDVLEALRETDPELTSKHVYNAMLDLGFTPRTIDGHMYWPVMLH